MREDDMLVQASLDARTHAYAPYSRFKVGAAILTSDGTIFTATYGHWTQGEFVLLATDDGPNFIEQFDQPFVRNLCDLCQPDEIGMFAVVVLDVFDQRECQQVVADFVSDPRGGLAERNESLRRKQFISECRVRYLKVMRLDSTHQYRR